MGTAKPSLYLAPGVVHVLCLDISRARFAVLDALGESILSSGEKRRGLGFYFQGDRLRFVRSRAFLRLALARYANRRPHDLQFDCEAFGRPVLRSVGNLYFSLSHCGPLLALAVCRQSCIGIDVASSHAAPVNHEAIMRRYFTAIERAQIHAHGGSQRYRRFIELWTLKEAYSKAIGLGLNKAWMDVDFSFVGDFALGFSDHALREASMEWGFGLYGVSERDRLSVAFRHPHRVSVFKTDELLNLTPWPIPRMRGLDPGACHQRGQGENSGQTAGKQRRSSCDEASSIAGSRNPQLGVAPLADPVGTA